MEWEVLPFVLFGVTTVVGAVVFRVLRHRWATSLIAPAALGMVVMIMFRQFSVDPACIKVGLSDTIESSIIALVSSCVFIHYLAFSLTNNARHKVFPCCRREDDVISPSYPEDLLT